MTIERGSAAVCDVLNDPFYSIKSFAVDMAGGRGGADQVGLAADRLMSVPAANIDSAGPQHQHNRE